MASSTQRQGRADHGSVGQAVAQDLSFLVREKDHMQVHIFDKPLEDVSLAKDEPVLTVPTPKAAVWTPDGGALALASQTEGVQVIELAAGDKEQQLHHVKEGPKTTQSLWWSSRGSILVTASPPHRGSSEPNVLAFRRKVAADGSVEEYELVASFLYSRLHRDEHMLQWTIDESLCGRLCPDGILHILDGLQLDAAPLLQLEVGAAIQSFQFCSVLHSGALRARLAVFVPDERDDMQRPVGPAEVTVWELMAPAEGGEELELHKRASCAVDTGQVCDLRWSASGTAVLAHCQTDVDETGHSYYGSTRLMLLSSDGQYQKDLCEPEEGSISKEPTCVQAVAWSPTRDEFIFIRGTQPAQATLWSWDGKAQELRLAKVLLEKAHRNTVRFNHFGSLVCLAGFGNLAGNMDFFGRLDGQSCDFVRVSNCQADCTVSAEWAPDGRHFLTAVLFPRMRVDNGVSVWRALNGLRVLRVPFEELYDTQWRPVLLSANTSTDVLREEVEHASKELESGAGGQGGEKKKQAYRPPGARGGGSNMVAAMMRGEVAPSAADERRSAARKPRPAVAAPEGRRRDEAHEEAAGGAHADQNDPHKDVAGSVAQTTQDTAASHGGSGAAQAHVAAPASSLGQAGGESRQAEAQAARSATSAAQPLQQQSAAAIGAAAVAGGYPSGAVAAAAAAKAARPAKAALPKRQSAVPVGMGAPIAQQHDIHSGHGQKLPCPTNNWQYVDPKQNIQGPFTLTEMQTWHQLGYFKPELQMRCDPSDQFIPFKDLFPHPMIPFQSYPKRPVHR